MKIKFKSLISVFLLAISFNACTSEQKKLSTQIDLLEKSMYADSSMVPDAVKAKEIIGLYTAFADKFPADTMSASFLFKAADISSKINETEQAISLFGKLYKLYPQNKNAPFALFLQGFIYENQVGDAVKAKTLL
ncbi:MAG: tetratricopeptide repeat protein [Bacteroidetes bacterium]|nr:tetratricopeptide repeat protein [Bacteroidota bacterium]